MPDSPLLFICHTGLDHPYVARLVTRLEEEGIRCWYYERDNFGQSIGSAVDRALMSCRALLFVMSANIPVASDYVQNEIITFVTTKRTVIPLRLQQPDHWWPEGVRSLIGARPVVMDSSGATPPDVLADIKRRVLAAEPSPQPTQASQACVPIPASPAEKRLPQIRRRSRFGVPSVSTAFIAAGIVFISVAYCIHVKNSRQESHDLDILSMERRISRMPMLVREKWDATIHEIDEIEKTLDGMDEAAMQREIARKELYAIAGAEENDIGKATAKYR